MAFRVRPTDPEAAFVRNIAVTMDGVLNTKWNPHDRVRRGGGQVCDHRTVAVDAIALGYRGTQRRRWM